MCTHTMRKLSHVRKHAGEGNSLLDSLQGAGGLGEWVWVGSSMRWLMKASVFWYVERPCGQKHCHWQCPSAMCAADKSASKFSCRNHCYRSIVVIVLLVVISWLLWMW